MKVLFLIIDVVCVMIVPGLMFIPIFRTVRENIEPLIGVRYRRYVAIVIALIAGTQYTYFDYTDLIKGTVTRWVYGPSESPLETSNYKIVGMTHLVSYPDTSACFADNSGCKYSFDSGRHFDVVTFFNQTADTFRAKDETGASQVLPYNWDGIWKRDPQLGPLRAGSSVAFGQYNFTGTSPDSLVVVSIREEAGLTLCGLNIYSLENNSWMLSGTLKAPNVLGKCEIEFTLNKVTIPRHLRGFYYQLTYQNGHFEDTSSF